MRTLSWTTAVPGLFLAALPAAALAGCGDDGGPAAGDGPASTPAAEGSGLQVRPVLFEASVAPDAGTDPRLAAKLEALRCDPSGDPELPGNPPAGQEAVACDLRGVGYALGPAAVDGGVAAAQVHESGDGYGVQVDLDDDAADALGALGQDAASSDSRIALLLDGVVLSAPTVAGTLGGSLQLGLDLSREQAQEYAERLGP